MTFLYFLGITLLCLGTSAADTLATSYMSLALTNSGIIKEQTSQYQKRSCESYKPDCTIDLEISKNDFKSTSSALQQSCTTDGISCFRLGLLLRPTAVVQDKSIPKETSYEQSLKYFDTACHKGISEGCTYAAIQRKDRNSLQIQCHQDNNIFSCRENHLVDILSIDTQRAQEAQKKLSLLCHQKDFFLSCGDLGIYLSGKRQDQKAVPLLQKACSLGDARGCYWLGHHVKNGDGIDKDPTKAQQYFKQACDSGIGDACMALIEYKQAHLQFDFVQQACLYGSARACVWLGNKKTNSELPYFAIACQLSENQPQACLMAGISLEETSEESLWYLSRSCQQGNAQGCYKSYEVYKAKGDIDTAITSVSQSCQMGYMLGCEKFAELQLSEQAPIQNWSKPIQLLEVACRSGLTTSCSIIENTARHIITNDCQKKQSPTSCYTLIRYLDGSLGGSKDPSQAFILAQTECQKNNIPACVKLGYYFISATGTAQNKEKAQELFIQTCSAQSGSGCYNLGLMHMETHKIEASLPFFQQACTYNDGRGCAQAGIFLRQQTKELEGIQLLEKSCSLGDATGCAHFGYIQARQNKIEDAISTLGYSCTYGHPDGCFNLAVIVHQNRSLAQFLFSDPELVIQESMHKACLLGHKIACDQKK